jgi:hypothetical protein
MQQFLRLQLAAISRFASGLIALANAQHDSTVFSQLLQVALCSRVSPHLAVHGRCEDQRNGLDWA